MGNYPLLKFVSTHAGILLHVSGTLGILIFLIVLGSILISYFDKKNIGDSLYLAFITAFTIGFGDVTLRTWVARVITLFIALFGVIFAGVLVATAVKALDITFHIKI